MDYCMAAQTHKHFSTLELNVLESRKKVTSADTVKVNEFKWFKTKQKLEPAYVLFCYIWFYYLK